MRIEPVHNRLGLVVGHRYFDDDDGREFFPPWREEAVRIETELMRRSIEFVKRWSRRLYGVHTDPQQG